MAAILPNEFREWWQAATEYALNDGEFRPPKWFGCRAYEFFNWCYDIGKVDPATFQELYRLIDYADKQLCRPRRDYPVNRGEGISYTPPEIDFDEMRTAMDRANIVIQRFIWFPDKKPSLPVGVVIDNGQVGGQHTGDEDSEATYIGNGVVLVAGHKLLLSRAQENFIEYLVANKAAATRALQKAGVGNPSKTASELKQISNGILASFIETPEGKKGAGFKTTIRDGRN